MLAKWQAVAYFVEGIGPVNVVHWTRPVIRENLLKDTNVPRQRSGPDTIGEVVPQNIKLEPLPSEVTQKVPKAKAHHFFVKDDDTVVLVSPAIAAWRTL